MAKVATKLPALVDPLPVPEVIEIDDEDARALLLTEFACLEIDDTRPMPLDPLGVL